MAVLLLEGLDRGLPVNHRRNNLAIFGNRLATHNDPIAVANRGINHRIARYFEHEEIARAGELAGEREDVVNNLLGKNRTTGGDPADGGHVDGRGDLNLDVLRAIGFRRGVAHRSDRRRRRYLTLRWFGRHAGNLAPEVGDLEGAGGADRARCTRQLQGDRAGISPRRRT